MKRFNFFKYYKDYNNFYNECIEHNIDFDSNHVFYGYIDSPNFVFSNTDKEDMGMNETDLQTLSEFYNKRYNAYCQDSGQCHVKIIGICRDDFDWYLVAEKDNDDIDIIFAYDAMHLNKKS